MRNFTYNEKFVIFKEDLANDTIAFGKAFDKFEAAHHDCDECPMCDAFGNCLAKMQWPRITMEMIEIIARWMVLEDEKVW